MRASIAAVLVSAVAVAGPAHAEGSGGPWTVVASPSPSAHASYLEAVAPVSSSTAWAVGARYRVSTTGTPGTLTELWNGSTWKVVPSPNATDGYNELFGVDALSTRNAWAVGYSNIALYGSERSLILRWNGSSWRIVASPNLGSNANILHDVDALSSTDAWAVGLGDSTSLSSGHTLILHWNGRRWSVVPSPNTGSGFAELNGVAALSPTDVWAVGSRQGHTLVEHWNGGSWQIVPSPDGARATSRLLGVAAVSPDDVWAVGSTAGSTSSDVLVEHWNGEAWTTVTAPDGAMPQSALTDVVALSATSVVAVGFTLDPLLVNNRTLTEYFDGGSWRVIPSPNPSPEYNTTVGVGGLAGGDTWAVGAADEDTLVLRATAP
jgi:hypothetical protein